MHYRIFAAAPLLLAGLAACTTIPAGPSVMVLPGTGKNFDQFRGDDAQCRQYATVQSGGASTTTAAQDSALRSAAVGTALGAAAGALVDGGSGAGIGAGAGAVAGVLTGMESGQVSAYHVQDRYDTAYIQCMYAQGHRVPVTGSYAPVTIPAPATAPAPGYYPPPPPPGYGAPLTAPPGAAPAPPPAPGAS